MSRKNRPRQKKAKRARKGLDIGAALEQGLDFLDKGLEIMDKAEQAYEKAARLNKRVRDDFREPIRAGARQPRQQLGHVNEFGFYVASDPPIKPIPPQEPQGEPRQPPMEPVKPKGDLTIEDARKILGLTPEDTKDEMERKWRDMIKVAHPDLGGDGALTHQLVMAKKRMLDYYYKGV